jgi:hypothetical protein
LFILFVVVVANSGRCKTVTKAATAAARRIQDREGGNDQRKSWSVLVAITIFVFPSETDTKRLAACWLGRPTPPALLTVQIWDPTAVDSVRSPAA